MFDRAPGPLIVVCLACALGLPAVLPGDRDLIVFLHDDAFYYFQVASNVVEGNEFTFDGLHRANGFQPLWLFVVAPLFAGVEGLVAPLRAIGLRQAGLIAAGGAILYGTLAPRLERAAAATVALALGALPGARAILFAIWRIRHDPSAGILPQGRSSMSCQPG